MDEREGIRTSHTVCPAVAAAAAAVSAAAHVLHCDARHPRGALQGPRHFTATTAFSRSPVAVDLSPSGVSAERRRAETANQLGEGWREGMDGGGGVCRGSGGRNEVAQSSK